MFYMCTTFPVHNTPSSGVLCTVRTEDKHFFHFPLYITIQLPSHCWLCSRVQQIPARRMTPQKTAGSPEAYTENRNENTGDRRNS
jgi:hypothetical protein